MHSIVYGAAIYNSDIISKTVGSTVNTFYNFINYISSETNHAKIFHELFKLDLEYRISIIDELVKDSCNIDNILIHKAILGLNEILNNINKELQQIDEMIRMHNKKYFSNWRDFNCDELVHSVKHHSDVLNKRYKMLIELLALYK